jgi:endonuclease YncB( thermonuclease family)
MKFISVLLWIVLLAPDLALAELLRGKVVKVADGDTVTVLRNDKAQERVRLLGIDAPEKKQDFGQKAKEELTRRVAGKMVDVEYRKRDRYGRILGKIVLIHEDVNLLQVRDGLAWHYDQFAKDQFSGDATKYAEAQVKARDEKRGIWSLKTASPPWEFRSYARKVASAKKNAKRARRTRD